MLLTSPKEPLGTQRIPANTREKKAMTAELREILIDIAQRWLEQDGDSPSCRWLTRSVSGPELVKL